MNRTAIIFLCLLSLNGFCQKRAAIFNFDIKENRYQLKPGDFHIHVHEVPDRSLYTDSSGGFSYAKYTEANAGKLDTQLTMNADFAFRLKDLKIGALYSVSIYYNIPLDTFNKQYLYRTRAVYQEFKLNSWTYEYKVLDNAGCNYDNSLKNRQCPKCRRKDRVLPVLYGLTASDPLEPDPYPVKGHHAGTDVTGCDPNWYCERDKLRF